MSSHSSVQKTDETSPVVATPTIITEKPPEADEDTDGIDYIFPSFGEGSSGSK